MTSILLSVEGFYIVVFTSSIVVILLLGRVGLSWLSLRDPNG